VSDPTQRPEDARLPDAVAARVLERAAQLDATAARSVSLDDLRSAALEAGIGAAALEQALAEIAAERTAAAAPAEPAKPGARPGGLRRHLLTAAAVVLLLVAATLFVRLITPAPGLPPGISVELAPVAPAAPAPPAAARTAPPPPAVVEVPRTPARR
jgi:hypothetical protein